MKLPLRLTKFIGPEKTATLLKGWKPISFKGQVPQIKAWFEKQSMLSEDQKMKLAHSKENSPVEAPQASTSKRLPQQVPNKPKQTPKTNHKAPFQEQLEKGDNARFELKEDIQSSINNISLKNELPRKYTPFNDRNLLNLNNDLHHTVTSNAEVETACNFKDIPRLEEWTTFSGEGEYNHMELMKTIDMFKEEFNIPHEYTSSRLHSLFTKSAKKWYYKMRQDHAKHS
ncbi:hypothetical protein O181_063264 [Austropuccinia psidii MF-1]|uniref:Uncharacterized protein n=1 Tax=Austropuccinia psidii MF-1 TaxID=1389203 RepID=A0A9Q3EM30_9BASI|nr:hypothetical protein [Austropuccinia psidii MF-1]